MPFPPQGLNLFILYHTFCWMSSSILKIKTLFKWITSDKNLSVFANGADDRNWTCNLLITNQTHYRLCYISGDDAMDNRWFKMHTTVHSVIYEIVLMFNIRKPNFTTYIIVLLNYLLQSSCFHLSNMFYICWTTFWYGGSWRTRTVTPPPLTATGSFQDCSLTN